MSTFNYSFESIVRQDDSFFNELTEGVARLRQSKKFDTKAVRDSFITQVIKEHTGLTTELTLMDYPGAATVPPSLVGSHVFADYNLNPTAGSIIDVKDIVIKGTVDPVNAKVGGVFSQLSAPIILGTGLFELHRMTDSEIAAIILHEVGHLFIYYQFVTTIAYGSLVINQTVLNVFNQDSYHKKEYQIRRAEETLGLEPESDIADLIDTSSDKLEIILVTRFYRHLKHRSVNGFYDVRNEEQLADTFAVKHGAGRALASGLHKLHKEYHQYGQRNFFAHILVEAAKTLSLLLSSSIGNRSILLSFDQPSKYDDPKDRLVFIKFQMIDDLKRLPNGNNTVRKQIVESLKEVDTILKEIEPRRTLLKTIHQSLTKVGRSLHAQTKQQKMIEEMLYNDLFYQSAKLKTLH